MSISRSNDSFKKVGWKTWIFLCKRCWWWWFNNRGQRLASIINRVRLGVVTTSKPKQKGCPARKSLAATTQKRGSNGLAFRPSERCVNNVCRWLCHWRRSYPTCAANRFCIVAEASPLALLFSGHAKRRVQGSLNSAKRHQYRVQVYGHFATHNLMYGLIDCIQKNQRKILYRVINLIKGGKQREFQ